MEDKSEILSFLPKCVLKLLSEGGHKFVLSEGSTLFADVAGFTPLTEALLVLGKEGSEELTRILNHHFSSMIEITDSYGGDVLRFAGDAMTVFFPDDDGSAAVSCGLAMLEKMKEYSKVESRAGKFELAMKIGCGAGTVQIGVVGPQGAGDYYALGDPLDVSADAEHHAQRGDLIVSTKVKVPGDLETRGIGEGFSLVTGVPLPPNSCRMPAVSAGTFDPSRFLPAYMIDQAQPETKGEHRGTTVTFLSFPPPAGKAEDIHSQLKKRYGETLSIVKKYGGVLNKLDFGDKGAKAVILFGAPVACENREEMAVRAALDIMSLEENRGLLRMGITSSHLFSGPLGSPSRREFTVMGDGINLSARLMGYAKPGEIITDLSTYEKSMNAVAFRERGEISVKGKSGLIKIFEPMSLREETRDTGGRKLFGRETVQQEVKEWLLSPDRVPLAVLGDPGSGKSAMADWLFREAKAREYNVQRIELQPFSRDVFFSLFSRLLKKIFEIGSAEELSKLMPLIPPVSREFAALLLPYFGYEEATDKVFENLGPKDRRDIAYSMLLALFENIDDTVFIIDNLSFADQASLDFLSYAVNNSEKKLLDVAAFSRMEITASGTFEIFRRVVELPPLEKVHIREFISEEFKIRSASDSVLKFLENKSKGNPRLISALVTSMKGEGLICEKEGVSYVDEDGLFRTQFPDSLEAVYLKEFDKLEVRQKQMLFEASVFGTNVSVNLLDKLSSFRENQIREMSGELSEKGFIRLDESGKRPYLVFSDTLLYEAIYNLAPFSLKRDLHRSIFQTLLEIEGDNKPPLFPYLAHHSEKSDDLKNAIKFHRLAGRYFLEQYDNVAALKHFVYVISTDDFNEATLKDSFDLFNVYLDLAKISECKELLRKIEVFYPELENSDKARFLNLKAAIDMREKNVDLVEANLRTALELSETSYDPAMTARTLLNLAGMVYGPTGRYEDGNNCLKRLLTLPEFKGDSVFRVVAQMNLGAIARHDGNLTLAHVNYKKSLDLAKKHKLMSRQTAVISNLTQLYYQSNSFDKALVYSAKGIALANLFSQRELYLDISIHRALSLWAKGMIKEAIDISLNTMEKSELYHQPYSLAMSHVIIGVFQFERLYFDESFSNILYSISGFNQISCGFEANASKLEFLRWNLFLEDYDKYNLLIKKWGGINHLISECRSFSVPSSVLTLLQPEAISPREDPDNAFIWWFKTRPKDILPGWRKELATKTGSLRSDLKIKWTWAYLSQNLTPPFNPLKLLAKEPGGIFGLRVLAIVWWHTSKEGNRRKAQKIRKILLDRLYLAKIHSDDRTWECIIKDQHISQAIKGRISAGNSLNRSKRKAGPKPASHRRSHKKAR